MKKKIALFLVCFLLVMVPVRGYAVSAPLPFGIGEEIILPFLLSLLGVQRATSVESYNDLAAYNDEIYNSLIESLSGLAGMEVVQEWIFKAVNGLIETDSIVWEKLREFAIDNYIAASADSASINSTINNVPLNFTFYNSPSFRTNISGGEYYTWTPDYGTMIASNSFIGASDSNKPLYRIQHYANGDIHYQVNVTYGSSYTYNGKTVYYTVSTGGRDSSYPIQSIDGSYNAIAAWAMVYGDAIYQSENIASYSDAFESVLTSSEKDDIIDGTSVIQLYNPAELQNGLEIISGGDPDEDPNLRKIPFAVTADWWNFLQQFGSGENSNQYVNAYNALNGLDQGTSIGRISDAYDSLGIASVGAAAAAAAEGILNLTDSNIYPQNESVADAITNTIPSNLTPVTPDSGIDNGSEQGLYKLPDLRDYFPFCIPFDLINLLSIFVAEPETPEFVIALSTGWSYAEENVSLDQWNGIANMVRNIELAVFILGLILITRNIIRG